MNIEEYREQFINDLRIDAEHEGTDSETQFIHKSLEQLEELGELNDPNPISIEMKGYKNRKLAFDAYSYDEADGALCLLYSDFTDKKRETETLTKGRIDDILGWMESFIDESVNLDISKYCDDSDPAIIISREFRKKIGKSMIDTEIMRFKFFIISDKTLSKQVKNVSREDFLGRPVELNVWTIERFYQTFMTNTSEIIEFDTSEFNCSGIQCVKADLGNKAGYDAYLGIVPGNFLANIYLKYGSKLLQGNVRAFLSFRGKVNKGIRETIKKRPEDFFTFNNGIAIVARSVDFTEDGSKIIHFRDPQIINGGQTTAALASAIIKKDTNEEGMKNLYVPMKLTVLNIKDEMSEEQTEQYNKMTRDISKCANSQNSVSEADFFSNHPYHVMMEKLSKKVMAPPVNGNPYQTIWFYERSRGKWEQEQMKLTKAQKNLFQEKNPRRQVIKKEKLAKCLNSIDMLPNKVCQSSAINFGYFAKEIGTKYDEGHDWINETYFKKCVDSVIIFDTLDYMISKASWYPKGGNKAQITPYTISKLMSLIPKGFDLDWKTIWQKQTLYPALAAELIKLAYVTHKFLIEEANGGLVRTISRTQKVWDDFKKVKYELSDDFIASLISKEETKTEERAAKRAHKFNSDIDNSVEIFNLGVKYWYKVYNDLVQSTILSYGDCAFIKGIADFIKRNRLPSPAQCKRLMRIVNKAEDKGYLMPE